MRRGGLSRHVPHRGVERGGTDPAAHAECGRRRRGRRALARAHRVAHPRASARRDGAVEERPRRIRVDGSIGETRGRSKGLPSIRYGALGTSRRDELAYVPFGAPTLSAVLEHYRTGYAKWRHRLVGVKVGLPVEHDPLQSVASVLETRRRGVRERLGRARCARSRRTTRGAAAAASAPRGTTTSGDATGRCGQATWTNVRGGGGSGRADGADGRG